MAPDLSRGLELSVFVPPLLDERRMPLEFVECA